MHTGGFGPHIYAAMLGAVLALTAIIYVLTDSVLATILANGIAGLVLGLLYVELQHREITEKRALARFILDVRVPKPIHALEALCVLVIDVVVRLGVGTVKSLLVPTPTAQHSVTTTQPPDMVGPVVIVAAVVLVGPLVEELVFRGLLQRLLTRHVGAAVAIIATAAVFAVMHIPNYGGFSTPLPALVIPLTVLSVDAVLWGALYAWSGNVTVPWLAHAGSNGVALLLWVV